MENLDSRAAEVLQFLHRSREVQRLLETEHLEMWDDLLALYLCFPEMFCSESREWGSMLTLGDTDPEEVREQVLHLLSSSEMPGKNTGG